MLRAAYCLFVGVGKANGSGFTNDGFEMCSKFHLHHFHTTLIDSREGCGSRSPRMTRNTSHFSAISHDSGGSTPRQDQAKSQM